MIDETKIGRILRGIRGEAPADIGKIKNCIKCVSQMMLDNPYIYECDLNPVIVAEDNNLYAVDIRIRCKV
jgi:acetyltransferase